MAGGRSAGGAGVGRGAGRVFGRSAVWMGRRRANSGVGGGQVVRQAGCGGGRIRFLDEPIFVMRIVKFFADDVDVMEVFYF